MSENKQDLLNKKQELEERITYAPDVHDVWEPVMLTLDRECSWSEYIALEEELISMLHGDDDLTDALVAQSRRLRLAAGFPEAARDAPTGDAQQLRQRAFELALGPITDDIAKPR